MKKYSKPTIWTGISAVYFLSINLETWCEFLIPATINEDKPQIVFAAKIIHNFFLQQRF